MNVSKGSLYRLTFAHLDKDETEETILVVANDMYSVKEIVPSEYLEYRLKLVDSYGDMYWCYYESNDGHTTSGYVWKVRFLDKGSNDADRDQYAYVAASDINQVAEIIKNTEFDRYCQVVSVVRENLAASFNTTAYHI